MVKGGGLEGQGSLSGRSGFGRCLFEMGWRWWLQAPLPDLSEKGPYLGP